MGFQISCKLISMQICYYDTSYLTIILISTSHLGQLFITTCIVVNNEMQILWLVAYFTECTMTWFCYTAYTAWLAMCYKDWKITNILVAIWPLRSDLSVSNFPRGACPSWYTLQSIQGWIQRLTKGNVYMYIACT